VALLLSSAKAQPVMAQQLATMPHLTQISHRFETNFHNNSTRRPLKKTSLGFPLVYLRR
jgi:hypothetical protein